MNQLKRRLLFLLRAVTLNGCIGVEAALISGCTFNLCNAWITTHILFQLGNVETVLLWSWCLTHVCPFHLTDNIIPHAIVICLDTIFITVLICLGAVLVSYGRFTRCPVGK